MTDEKKYEEGQGAGGVTPPKGPTEQADYAEARRVEKERVQRVVVAAVMALLGKGWTLESLKTSLDAVAAKNWRDATAREPEDELGEYVADHLASWHVRIVLKYEATENGGKPRVKLTFEEDDSHDSAIIDAEKNSALGKILLGIVRARE